MKLFQPKCKNCKKPIQKKELFIRKKLVCRECYNGFYDCVNHLSALADKLRATKIKPYYDDNGLEHCGMCGTMLPNTSIDKCKECGTEIDWSGEDE